MHVVYLFGSGTLGVIPDVIENHISEIIKQTNREVRFIVGGRNGADSAFHKTLSAVGARSLSNIYSIGNPTNNNYELDTYTFDMENDTDKKTIKIKGVNGDVLEEFDNVENVEDIKNKPSYFDFLNRQMCRDCTFAICYWDGQSKNTLRTIDRLKAQGKYVYVYTAQI